MALNGMLETYLITDPGRVRDNNEDAIDEEESRGLLILADGMGGYRAGEIASGICVATVKDTVISHWHQLTGQADEAENGLSDVGALLRTSIEKAHSTIYQVSQTQPQCEGMGTTAVVLLVYRNRAAIAYVGDSRLYRLRGEQLTQVTTDHSLVEELVARGLYTRDEAKENVNKNIVTRALGIEPEVEVDVLEEDLQVGDTLLMCTDGLTDLVSDEAIRLTLMENADNLRAAGERLVSLANEKGGKDNISVILARVNREFTRPRRWYERFTEWF